MYRKIHIALGALMLLAMFTAIPAMMFVAQASPVSAKTAVAKCEAPSNLARLDLALTRTMRRIAAGLPVTIVALGSSSTAGAGASAPSHSYPSQLAANLAEMFSGHPIKVINRGINGQEAADMVARLDETVLAEKPDLVVWQVGTNAVLRDQDIQQLGASIHDGLVRLKASGADVVLMDLQYAPAVLAKPEHEGVVSFIGSLAKQHNVNVFRRFAVMQSWHKARGMAFEDFISPDGLHLNDEGYRCAAKVLASSLAEAASRPVVTAGNSTF
jgi:lysophospholipase L1-like esterase